MKNKATARYILEIPFPSVSCLALPPSSLAYPKYLYKRPHVSAPISVMYPKKTGLEGLDRYSPEQEKVKIHIQR